MSLPSSRRRLALRAAVATAALAGAVLAPAAMASAETTPPTGTPTATASTETTPPTAKPTPSTETTPPTAKPTASAETTPPTDPAATTPAGTLIRTDKLKGGLTAEVYRHGDAHIYYTAVVLKGDRQLGTLTAGGGYAAEETRVFEGVQVTLTWTGTVTSVNDTGSDGQGPEIPVKCVATLEKGIGAGTQALLTITPQGPSVVFEDAGTGKVVAQLSRNNPKLPASAGFLGEILRPNSHAPQLRTTMEGGGHPASVTDFPKLPKGCSFTYGNTPDTGNSNNDAQTTVVPKGSVAAGAETGQGGDRTMVAVGGAAAALGAAGIGFVALRRRTASAGR